MSFFFNYLAQKKGMALVREMKKIFQKFPNLATEIPEEPLLAVILLILF
jgi:hypothetical protein